MFVADPFLYRRRNDSRSSVTTRAIGSPRNSSKLSLATGVVPSAVARNNRPSPSTTILLATDLLLLLVAVLPLLGRRPLGRARKRLRLLHLRPSPSPSMRPTTILLITPFIPTPTSKHSTHTSRHRSTKRIPLSLPVPLVDAPRRTSKPSGPPTTFLPPLLPCSPLRPALLHQDPS